MSLETAWLGVLGLMLAGYFVLGGYDYGAQMLHPFLGGADDATGAEEVREADRSGGNAALEAIAPFFLGNEVWLVAFAGVLFGAFPHLEGNLLSGLYPLIVAILAGLVLGNAAVQLRRRSRGAGARRVWDALVVVGGALPAVCWGLVTGLLLRGVPRRADGSFHVGFGEVFHPFVLACGVAVLLLFAAHGAAFVAVRATRAAVVERAGGLGGRLIAASAAAGLIAFVLTLFGQGAHMTDRTSSVILAVAVFAALGAAWWSLSTGNQVRAFVSTCVATALPVLLLGVGQYPYLLITGAGRGLHIDDAVADHETLKLLSVIGVFIVPTILAYQAWSWWAFRGRTGRRHLSYF